MCVSEWFEFFVELLYCQIHYIYMGGNCDNKEGILWYEHPFPRVLGYKRGSDIKEGDITKVRCILRILY